MHRTHGGHIVEIRNNIQKPLPSDIHTPACCKAAENVLSHLQRILGPRLYPVLIEYMQREYLGNEMGVREFMVTRPDLFRRALCDILGDAGPAILHIIAKRPILIEGKGP